MVDAVWHPHSLAKQLYMENPDRVIVYRDKQLSYYIPSEKSRRIILRRGVLLFSKGLKSVKYLNRIYCYTELRKNKVKL